jgi:hypothetical protein
VKIPGLRRGRPLPQDDAEAVGLGELGDRDRRVLAWSPLAMGGVAVATEAGLHARTPAGRVVTRPWTDVTRASWEAESSALAVWWVDARQPLPLEIVDQSRLPDVIYDRVRRSVLVSTEVVLDGGSSVWVALRRGVGDEFVVQAVAPAGVRLDDPAVAPLVAAAKHDLRAQAGLE